MIIPEDNPMTFEAVLLGEKLFNDPILSGDGTQSCASCHIKSSSFSDPNQFSTGINNIQGNRQASTLINLGWTNSFFWVGRASSLEQQAFEPIRNPIEMNNSWENVENTLNNSEEYTLLLIITAAFETL